MADRPAGLVLIVAPTGRDAFLAADVLGKAGVTARICPSLGALAAAIDNDVGAVLLAEEALGSADTSFFLNALRAQEPWSDLPILLLTHTQPGRAHTATAVARLRPATLITLLERPFRAATLVYSVEAALRARQRQWQVRDLIAERTAAERALAESAERLRAATDAAKVGTWDYFPLTGELIWNDHCRAQFALPADAPVNYEVFLAGLHPDDRARADAAVIEALDPRGTGHFNIEFRTIGFDDCIERWLVSTGRAKFELGRAVRFTGTTVDITERKRNEQQLAEAHRFLHSAIDALSSHVAVLNEHGVILTVNEAWRRFADENQYDGHNYGVGSNYVEECKQASSDCLETDTVGQGLLAVLRGERQEFHLEYPCHSPTQQRWFMMHVTAFHTPGPRRVVVAHENITDRKLAEERIRESQEQLRLVIDNAAALVVYCDQERRYRFANRQYVERLGLRPGHVIGRTIAEVVGSVAYETFRRYVDEVLAGHAVEFEEKIPYEQLGPRWMHCAYVPDKDERGEVRGFVALIRDVQERREAEDALREAKSQAEAANAAKDHFLATLSHELRTPLTPVLMALADHVSNPDLTGELREDLAMIRRNVELEARLIDDLLDLTRVSRGKIELHPEIVDMHKVLQEALEVCTANDTVRRQITVELEPQAEAHYVQADRARLQQVFWNLINNALKFSPNDSHVIIRTDNPSEGRIAVEVRDHGFGIEPEKLPRLFDAFEQGGRAITKRFGGLGLGLAISKALVDLHNGTIRAHSEGRNKGASFIVELDTCAPAAAISHPASADGANVARPLHVLLVEDHETTLAVLTRLLRRAGHEVTPASRVAEARQRLSEQRFDLLISDLGLPDGTGTDLVRGLDGHAMPSIALSGYGMDADVRECLEAGFHSHVTKPVDWQRLSATIQQITAGER
jgi:PAS domain S-box-containing protein